MAPLAVDPAALDSAGAEVVTAGEGLGSVIATFWKMKTLLEYFLKYLKCYI
jgi:hypothetical protein